MDMTQHGHSKPSIFSNDKFLGKESGQTWSSSLWPGGKEDGPRDQSLPPGLSDRLKKREDKGWLLLLGVDIRAGRMWPTKEPIWLWMWLVGREGTRAKEGSQETEVWQANSGALRLDGRTCGHAESAENQSSQIGENRPWAETLVRVNRQGNHLSGEPQSKRRNWQNELRRQRAEKYWKMFYLFCLCEGCEEESTKERKKEFLHSC